jgi:hypothetical protein
MRKTKNPHQFLTKSVWSFFFASSGNKYRLSYAFLLKLYNLSSFWSTWNLIQIKIDEKKVWNEGKYKKKSVETAESCFLSLYCSFSCFPMSIFELDLSLILLCIVAMNVLCFFSFSFSTPVDDFISVKIKYKFTFCLKCSFALSLI